MTRSIHIILACILGVGLAESASAQVQSGPPLRPPTNVRAMDRPDDAGGWILISWEYSSDDAGLGGRVVAYRVERGTSRDGPWRSVEVLGPQKSSTKDKSPALSERGLYNGEPLFSPSGHDVIEKAGVTTDFFPSISCTETTCPGTPCTRNKQFFGLADVGGANYDGQLSVRSAENLPAVGGIAERVVDSSAVPVDASDSGSSALTYAGLAGAVAAGTVAAAAGGWYARRRFAQRRVRF